MHYILDSGFGVAQGNFHLAGVVKNFACWMLVYVKVLFVHMLNFRWEKYHDLFIDVILDYTFWSSCHSLSYVIMTWESTCMYY